MTDPRCGEHGVLKTTCAGWKHYEKMLTAVDFYQDNLRLRAELARLRERFDQIQEERDLFGHQLARAKGELAALRDDRDAWRDGYNRQHLLYDDEARLLKLAKAELAELKEAVRAAQAAYVMQGSVGNRLRQLIEADHGEPT